MILALYKDTSSLETLINNLAEQEFDERCISIITRDEALPDRILKTPGPLSGNLTASTSKKLLAYGMSKQDLTKISKSLQKGSVIVLLDVSSDLSSVAEASLKDYNPVSIKAY
jgi:hypothetical protein